MIGESSLRKTGGPNPVTRMRPGVMRQTSSLGLVNKGGGCGTGRTEATLRIEASLPSGAFAWHVAPPAVPRLDRLKR
jgi:hypothetical protein